MPMAAIEAHHGNPVIERKESIAVIAVVRIEPSGSTSSGLGMAPASMVTVLLPPTVQAE